MAGSSGLIETTALTTFGSARSRGSSVGDANVAIGVPSRSSGSKTCATARGSSVGKSPCRLITLEKRRSGSTRLRAWQIRSVPDGKVGIGYYRLATGSLHRLGNGRFRAGNHNRSDVGLHCSAQDMDDHRRSRDIGQRFVRESGGLQPSRDQDYCLTHGISKTGGRQSTTHRGNVLRPSGAGAGKLDGCRASSVEPHATGAAARTPAATVRRGD